MAEGDGAAKFRRNSGGSGDSDAEDEAVILDLINLKTSETVENHAPRRDENPFSFKHFLQNDRNYQNQGARPKVYRNEAPPPQPSPVHAPHSPTENVPRPTEFPSARLPDFVQDHLVIEQCYLGNTPANYNLDNLPDFTFARGTNGPSSGIRRDASTGGSIPLDLPVRPQAEFPLDLPTGDHPLGTRSCPSTAEVGNSTSLPDFLADGAVRGQSEVSGVGTSTSDLGPSTSERYRLELESSRRQLNEQCRRTEYLSRELELARNKEHEYTQNLAKALEQVEENLERSNVRAAASENTIVKLRHEVKCLHSEINALRRENRVLRGEEGATGGPQSNIPDVQSQRLARELRTAASTAEHSLRNLLNGVENLRMLASSLESASRVEESVDYNSDAERDTGPAL